MCNNKFLYFFYFSGISFTGAPSLGKMMFKRMATKAATTTAELPNREFIHVGRPAISPSTWAIMITSSSLFFLFHFVEERLFPCVHSGTGRYSCDFAHSSSASSDFACRASRSTKVYRDGTFPSHTMSL